METRTFDVLTVGSPMHDPAALRAALAPYLSSLASLGGREAGEEALSGPGPVALLVATGGTEAATLRLRALRAAASPGEPLLLLALPAHNSLPAALARLAEALDDLRVLGRLRRSRIGLVGIPSDWLVASVPATAAVREVWGPETVNVDLAPLLDAPLREPDEAALGLAASFSGDASATREPDDAGVRRASTVHSALAALASRERLDAVAVRCFDLVTERGTSGCLALSALNDAGTVAACEGDLASAVGMLWVKELLGTASFMANPSSADPATGRLRLAHCTVPRSLVTRWELRSHFESGLGVAIAGDLAAGPVTLLRLGGRRLDRLFLAEGEAIPVPRREDLCRTQVDVRLEPAAIAELLERPLGNHLLLVPGHRAARLRGFQEWAVGETTDARDAA